jgi:hypothetical protein
MLSNLKVNLEGYDLIKALEISKYRECNIDDLIKDLIEEEYIYLIDKGKI